MFQALLGKAKDILKDRFHDTVKSVYPRYNAEKGRMEIVLEVYNLAVAEEKREIFTARYGKFGMTVVFEQAEEKTS